MYLPRPMIVKGDGPVMKLRRWYSQFYSTGTPIVAEHAELQDKPSETCKTSCDDFKDSGNLKW